MTSMSAVATAMSPQSRTRSAAVAVSTLVALAGVATLWLVAGPLGLGTSLLTHGLFILPGVLILRRTTFGGGGWLPIAAFGPLLGIALSSVSLLAFWAAGARGPWILVAAPLLVCPLALAAPRVQGRWLPITPSRADLLPLMVLLGLVPLLVALPFSHVGTLLPEGEAYRAYFTADYVWRRAVVVELAKGDFLPLNPFFLRDELHYYWLPHLLIAVEYRWLYDRVNVNELLLVNSVVIDFAFVTFLYGIGRLFIGRPAFVAAGVACSILFSSFEGLYGIWDHLRVGAPLWLLRNFNVDAITRWLLDAMPIDGLQRLLWYQPHHALGYAMGFLGLLAVARRARRTDPAVFAVAGTLLAMSTLISSFGGLMLTSAAALHEGVSVLRHRDWKRAGVHMLAACVPLLLAVWVIRDLRYVDPGGQVITVGLNAMATRHAIPATFLSFGPMLLIAGPALWFAWQRRRDDFSTAFALLATCAVFYFFVDIRDHQNVYVGWRVGHLTFIMCGALVALTFERVAALAAGGRRAAQFAILVALLCAAPTVVIDAYNTQDVTNQLRSAGFRWTLILSSDELAAFRWIKSETRPDAIFQVDPVVRDADTWAYLAAFGERRMSAGLPISMVPLDKYVYESGRIRHVYDEPAGEAYDRARRSGVQFVLVGPPERAAHPGVEARLDSVPDLLPVVFRNGSISIYHVAGS